MKHFTLPWRGAVFVEGVEVDVGQQLAPVHPGLDGPEAAKDPDLLNVADDRHDLEPLELRVHGVQAADEVLEEELEGLRQTEHGLAGNHEGRHLLAAVVDNLALVGRRVVGGRDGRRAVAETSVHELVHAGGELVVAAGRGSRGGSGEVSVVARRQKRRSVVAQHGGHGHHGGHGRRNEGGWTTSMGRRQVGSREGPETSRKSESGGVRGRNRADRRWGPDSRRWCRRSSVGWRLLVFVRRVVVVGWSCLAAGVHSCRSTRWWSSARQAHRTVQRTWTCFKQEQPVKLFCVYDSSIDRMWGPQLSLLFVHWRKKFQATAKMIWFWVNGCPDVFSAKFRQRFSVKMRKTELKVRRSESASRDNDEMREM